MAADKRLIMAAANYWGGPITTGTQHYARQFLRTGWKVAYLSDQISPLHLARLRSRAFTLDKFRIWWRGGVREGDRFWGYNHLTLLPVFNAPILRSRFAVRHSLDLSVPNLFGKLRAEGFDEADVLWFDHLIFTGLLDRIRAGATVYRMADDARLFPEAYPPALLANTNRMLREVDLVVVTAQRLYDAVVRERSEGVLYVPNGVDYDHFAGGDWEPPEDYASIPEPRVVYAGSLEPWFDTDLLYDVARSRPGVSFVIIGPVRIDLSKLRRLENVFVLGRRSYDVLPGYFAHADVGIIPFRHSAMIDAVNPIKLYEYLAAGLPVVATAWEELRRLGSPALLAEGAGEFGEALDQALRDPGDPEEKRAFARERSWAQRFATIAATLGIDR